MQSSKGPAGRKAGEQGRLYVVATPIGNLGDLAPRALEVLSSVATILAEDTRRTRPLLTHFGIGARLESHHSHNEAVTCARLVTRLLGGESLALVSDAGTPAVSDPGYRLVRAAIDAGVAVSPIPGPSAPIAALVASGLPADRFVFAGYPPRKDAALRRFLADLDSGATLVLLESPRRLGQTLAAAAAVLGDDRPAVVARELTKVHEEFVRGSLAELAERFREPARGEVTLCIGGRAEATPVAISDNELRERYAHLLAAGSAPAAARQMLGDATGMRRREIYRALHLSEPSNDAGDDP